MKIQNALKILLACSNSKRLFTTFREIIFENCFGFLIVYFLDFLDILTNCVSKEIRFASIMYDAGVNYNLGMLGNLVA